MSVQKVVYGQRVQDNTTTYTTALTLPSTLTIQADTPHVRGSVLTSDRHIQFRVKIKESAWLVVAPVGLVLLFRRRHRLPLGCRGRIPPSDLLPPSAISLGIRSPRDLRYWTIRFHVPWLPLWTVLAGVALESGLDYVRRVSVQDDTGTRSPRPRRAPARPRARADAIRITGATPRQPR